MRSNSYRVSSSIMLKDSIQGLQEIPVRLSQPAITCSKLTIETLEQSVKYVQS